MTMFARVLGLLLCLLFGLVASSASAQSETPPLTAMVHGRVIDSESREPIGEAEVVVVGSASRAYTDEAGPRMRVRRSVPTIRAITPRRFCSPGCTAWKRARAASKSFCKMELRCKSSNRRESTSC